MNTTQLLYRIALLAWALLVMLQQAEANHSVPEFLRFVQKAESGEPIVIAYLGGSITCGATTDPRVGTNADGEDYNYASYDANKDSWRALSYEWLRDRYEQKPGQFRQVNAAIGGTPSLLGAYRLEQDVLGTKPDLVFIEFAVNDSGLAKLTLNRPDAPNSILRTTQSIVGRLQEQNSDVAILTPLSPRRMLKGSKHLPWAEHLDLGHDQTRLAAERLRIPYVSLKTAFYGGANERPSKPYYDGADSAGNYVHPAPEGYRAYADALERTLTQLFETGVFPFVLPEADRGHVFPFPVNPRLILPEILVLHAKGWKVETPEIPEEPILKGHACLVPTSNGALEYTFYGTAVSLWLDSQSTGCLEIYLDGKKRGLYTNNVRIQGDFQGRFCSVAFSLDSSEPHTLRLLPIVKTSAKPPSILLLAIAVDVRNEDKEAP